MPAAWLVNRLIGTPLFLETLDGSFSAVSTPIFTIKYVLKSSRWDLQDAHYSTDLRARFFSTKNQRILIKILIFQKNVKCCKIRLKLQFLQEKIEIFKRKMHINEILQNFLEIWDFDGLGVGGAVFCPRNWYFPSWGVPGRIQPTH